MAQTPHGMELFEAEVTQADGPCHAGHKKGDKFALNCWDTGGLCGFFYHDIFPALSLMQFGGAYPWDTPGQTRVVCCDKNVNLTMVIRKQESE